MSLTHTHTHTHTHILTAGSQTGCKAASNFCKPPSEQFLYESCAHVTWRSHCPPLWTGCMRISLRTCKFSSQTRWQSRNECVEYDWAVWLVSTRWLVFVCCRLFEPVTHESCVLDTTDTQSLYKVHQRLKWRACGRWGRCCSIYVSAVLWAGVRGNIPGETKHPVPAEGNQTCPWAAASR